MDTGQWHIIEDIIDQALELEEAERMAFVKSKTEKDSSLYQQVVDFLDSIEESGKTRFLEPDTEVKKAVFRDYFEELDAARSAKKLIGTKIGPFTLTHLLGQGGMATVYKGVRSDGKVHQEVAIKVLYSSINSEESIVRFRMEQEILANLKHANIAFFVDAGITEAGNPYLIMEYVDGIPINEYCVQNKPSLNERLHIFKQLCEAISYAHRNMVVHRDLKPGNIFVTNEGQIKVLDFSIAKLLDSSFSDQEMVQTRTGLRLLSPTYCAPEQFRSAPITTATDVYTLGLVLYEVLTDKKAIDGKNKTLMEIEKSICASNFRHTLQLPLNIEQDLKAIIYKAIRIEPEYRYESAAQLLNDIHRYQNNLPVSAQKDTVKYRVRKFIRRHKKGMATSVAFIIILLSLGGFYTIKIKQERDKANLEAGRARATANFLVSIFSNADIANNYKNITAEDILDKGSELVQSQFNNQPLTKEYILRKIGNIYNNLELFNKAAPLLAASLELCEANTHPNDLLRAQCYYDYGSNQISIQKFDKAYTYLTKSRAILTKFPPSQENKDRLAINASELGWIQYEKGNYAAADSLISLALDYHLKNKSKDQAYQIAICQLYLGWAKNGQGAYKKAGVLFSKSLEGFKNLDQVPEHKMALALSGKGRNLFDQGEFTQAEPLIAEAIPTIKEIYGPLNSQYASVLKVMGLIKMRLNKLDESQKYLTQALEVYRSSLGENNSNYVIALGEIGSLAFYRKEYKKSAAIFKSVVEKNKQILGDTHPEIATGLNNLATVLERSGQEETSIHYYKEALQIASKNYRPAHPNPIRIRHNLAKAYVSIHDFSSAETLYLENYFLLKQYKNTMQKSLQELIINDLVNLYEAWDHKKEADKYKTELSAFSE